MRVKDLMTKDVVAVRPEASLKEVAEILAERGISGVPVVGEGGEVLGVVSEADILQKEAGPARRTGGLFSWLLMGDAGAEAKFSARTAKGAMTSPAVSIGPEAQPAEAARKMTELGVNRLPVLDHDQKLVGIITRGDLVRAFTRTDEELLREIRDDVLVKTLWIPAERVQVAVKGGEVTLSGRVETKAEAELVASFVERVPGVVSVTSDVGFEYDERPPPRNSSRADSTR
jgi:CBS domain-containing protein